MSAKYDVYTKEGQLQVPKLRTICLQVAKEFPGLCASAFFEEVRGRIMPRPDEFDMRGAVLMFVDEGDLKYDHNWKVRLGDAQ